MAKTSRNRRKRGNNSDYKKLPKLWKQIYEFIRQTKGVMFDWIPLARKKKPGTRPKVTIRKSGGN